MAEETEDGKKRFETWCGLVIAVFAAVLAITDLGGGKYGDDELIAHNEKGGAYLWYQSKGIKETLVEGQRDTLKALIEAGSIKPEQLPAIQKMVESLDADAARYGKEKKEILLGSKTVGQENWVQDVGGEMGKVTGAQEWQAKADALNDVGDVFDYATLFLQICLVMGAMSLILQNAKLGRTFFTIMIVLGIVGTGFAVMAFMQAGGVG
ncbi:MAG TPA: DUF4337 domain-containing protein [Thermoanaerobaculia bacterium]|jgi:hypothetical protein|nr:DUF4337 domain-containing protein [Thermoanaerobaculia bacterium]